MSSFSVEGLDRLKLIMDEFPEKGYKRPVVTAFKRAAVPVKRAMKDSIPDNLSPIGKALKTVAMRGDTPTVLVGIFANKGVYRNRRRVTIDPYLLGLWHNYGTLGQRANRFHKFKRPVRTKRPKRGWEEGRAMADGIKAGLFIEQAWEKSKNVAQGVFEREVEKEIDKFFEANAVR